MNQTATYLHIIDQNLSLLHEIQGTYRIFITDFVTEIFTSSINIYNIIDIMYHGRPLLGSEPKQTEGAVSE